MLDADPLFAEVTAHDYRLAAGSPAVDAGWNNAAPRDDFDADGDGDTDEFVPVDLDGAPRFVGGVAPDPTGCGVPVIVDLGAYERQDGNAVQLVFADMNGDGSVGTDDLMILLASWGETDTTCLADLDLDGATTFEDLLMLLHSWG